jgi:hypothetical protein
VSQSRQQQHRRERVREIFIYSIRIEPSIFDFSEEILCKLYNIGCRGGFKGEMTTKRFQMERERGRENSKLL